MKYIPFVLVLIAAACSPTRYYIVRHAEKTVLTKDSADMKMNNPPLSEAGKVRAIVLREELKDKNIKYIFSTNYLRTISTAQPLSELKGTTSVQLYSPAKDSVAPFVNRLKEIHKGNVLVVGHSNTVDDLANTLCGKTVIPGDLADTEYDNLFIVKRKGKRMDFSRKKYGYPSNPETEKPKM